jgi:hypothetical protein
MIGWYPPATWRRSSRCEAGACVEVAAVAQGVGMRDSTVTGGQDGVGPDRHDQGGGPVLVFSRPAWAAFVAGLRAGDFEPGVSPRRRYDSPPVSPTGAARTSSMAYF